MMLVVVTRVEAEQVAAKMIQIQVVNNLQIQNS